jgi:hypothetical protein
MHDRNISLNDLNLLRSWMESMPEVPDAPWYKDFGSFKLCGEGPVSENVSSASSSGEGTKGLANPARSSRYTGFIYVRCPTQDLLPRNLRLPDERA